MYVHVLYNYYIHYYYNCGKAHLCSWSIGLVSGVDTALAAVCGNMYFYMHLYGHFSGAHVLACACYCIIFPEPPLPLWCHCSIDPTTNQSDNMGFNPVPFSLFVQIHSLHLDMYIYLCHHVHVYIPLPSCTCIYIHSR